jgi:hypothetical protein
LQLVNLSFTLEERMSGFSCCLTFDGPPLSVVTKEQLLSIARMMAQQEQTKRRFRSDDLQGEMRTDYASRHLGFITGVLFEAEVTHEGGDTSVHFLATAAELKEPLEGIWGSAAFLLLE